MPSKKKSSKTPSSKLSNNNSSDLLSPSSPSSSSYSISSSPFNPNLVEQDISSSLDEASVKFPSLISTAALVARVTDDVVSSSRGCKVWLSESVMLSHSISPGSIVSVSLASMENVMGGGFPLSRLSDECARQFGLELPEKLDDEAGDFFVLATVFPSCKVLKNGVRLSLNLSCMLGCPASGRIAFVYPVRCQSLTENGNGGRRDLLASSTSLNSCKELYLSLVHIKDNSKVESAAPSHVDRSKEVTNRQVNNGKISSPKTPSIQEAEVTSPFPMQSHKLDYNKSGSAATHLSSVSFNLIDVNEVLGDDSSRKLLEICSASWLCTLVLLSGNFVRVPVLSRLCIFQVVGSEIMSPDSDHWNTKNRDLPAIQDYGKETICSFSVDKETKVHLLLPGDPMVETSRRKRLPLAELAHGRTVDNMGVDFPKLGGLSREFAMLKDIIVSAVEGTVASLGLRPTKGVLLHGPPGTGKTTLARLCAQDAGVNLFPVNGPEIISQYHGESEQALNEVFAKASQAAPAVVFIDELDSIAPARKDGGDDLSQRMVATLLNLMDGISRTDGILIIAATNRPESIEPALRRPGRLDREIEIGVPSPGQRYEILVALLGEMQHSLFEKDIQHLAMATHGFVGADLAALCNEAAIVRIRQYVNLNRCDGDSDFKLSTVAFDSFRQTSNRQSDVFLNGDVDIAQSSGDSAKSNSEQLSCTSGTQHSDFMDGIGLMGTHVQNDILRITSEDFEKARVRIRPSAMREVILEVPKVSWQDVGGQLEVKMQLMEAVEWPQKHKDAFKRIGTRPPTGILLFGPPGCSKTLLARAVASEAGLNFLAVKGPELFSKWVGESEKAVRSLFSKARANAPSIIFFDEIDGLAIIRGKESDGVSVGDRVMSQLLVELDGLQQRGSVTVIAATNRPDKIDSALLRPGRFDRLLYVGPPNAKDREDIFRIHLQKMPCSSDVSISELSLLTEGCTGADISLICREAAIAAIEENISVAEITMEQLKSGIRNVQPSDVRMYDELLNKFQRLVCSTAQEDNSGCEPCSSKPSQSPFWSRVRSAVLSLFGY